MQKREKAETHEPPDTTETIQILDSHIQERVNSGYEAPTAWLFKGLTILFHHNTPDDAESTEKDATEMNQEYRFHVARNAASFGGASIASSLKNLATRPTHIVVDPSCPSSELTSIRSSWASRGKKQPHLVSVKWIEESWDERTLLDEERMYS